MAEAAEGRHLGDALGRAAAGHVDLTVPAHEGGGFVEVVEFVNTF